jgi:outer membrane protein assembly factor BamB
LIPQGAAPRRASRPLTGTLGKRLQRPLVLEVLEDRRCPSGGYLFVDSFNTRDVLRYDEATGAFVNEFAKQNSGGLYSSVDMDFGPGHNLYVSNGLFSNQNRPNDVLKFRGTDGAFLSDFADSGQLTDPRGIIFGPDGNLYVADGLDHGQVLRYDGTTGAFIDTFVAPDSGGLSHPAQMLFGPDNNLYVDCGDKSEVLRYNGTTGTFIDVFVRPHDGGLDHGVSMAFGPDGNLYVANTQLNLATGGGILRYNGQTGAFMNTFVPAGSGGMLKPFSILFGPSGNVYIGSAGAATGSQTAEPHTSTVLRFDGANGAFLGTFVGPDSGGLRYPAALLFSETDPMTHAFNGGGGQELTAAPDAANPVHQTPAANQVQPLPAQAFARRQAAGAEAPGLGSVLVRLTDLGAGHTVWPNAAAAGPDGFVGPTLGGGVELAAPGSQVEGNRSDLPTAPAQDAGPALGRSREADGLTAEALTAGTFRVPPPGPGPFDVAVLNWLFAGS